MEEKDLRREEAAKKWISHFEEHDWDHNLLLDSAGCCCSDCFEALCRAVVISLRNEGVQVHGYFYKDGVCCLNLRKPGAEKEKYFLPIIAELFESLDLRWVSLPLGMDHKCPEEDYKDFLEVIYDPFTLADPAAGIELEEVAE